MLSYPWVYTDVPSFNLLPQESFYLPPLTYLLPPTPKVRNMAPIIDLINYSIHTSIYIYIYIYIYTHTHAHIYNIMYVWYQKCWCILPWETILSTRTQNTCTFSFFFLNTKSYTLCSFPKILRSVTSSLLHHLTEVIACTLHIIR